MKLTDFSFNLPKDLISTKPSNPRDASRLLHHVSSNRFEDLQFKNIISLLNKGDVLVVNDTKVVPSEIMGLKANNLGERSKIMFTFIENLKDGIWSCYVKPGKKIQENDVVSIYGVDCRIIKKSERIVLVNFNGKNHEFKKNLEKYGNLMLPPYITSRRKYKKSDEEDYQTVYSKNLGSIAAPTAGLHFTEDLLKEIKSKQVNIKNVTLSVGSGTFSKLENEKVEENLLFKEKCFLSKDTSKFLNSAYKDPKRKIIAVGTTTLRVLETSFINNNSFEPIDTFTDIFIYPGKKIKSIDSLITNFHLPQSSLFILICAFIGRANAVKMYHHAIRKRYRFYSYGDSCFLNNG
ncbi:MAG: tRNA preQ1(34) S-adenosylmethionine ribosyltransferase-isomerase QueA [Rhodobiaceae bacterium]|nr:tRNA preQ1(34) S-adenosylmethionine ribosyltransferase-isomerase QueA [Rhodobiaceae bacterium]